MGRSWLEVKERHSQSKWDGRFMDLAKLVSTWSRDPSTQVGAVIARPDKTVASLGFNGFPRGTSDDPANYEDRELKLARVVHAEVNAILHARERLDGYTMYVHPPGYGPSCDRCAAVICQTGIKRIVYKFDSLTDFAVRWQEAIDRGNAMFEEAGIEITQL